MNTQKVALQIATLRKSKGITQNELGERVGVSFQAVSKWERGETLPDISLLPDIANVLETSIDNILIGGEKQIEYKGKFSVSDMKSGIESLKKMGEYLGKNNILYCSAIKGINNSMNTDIEKAFCDDYTFEAFLAEAVIQNLIAGMYVDLTDVKNSFKYDNFKNVVLDFCKKYDLK